MLKCKPRNLVRLLDVIWSEDDVYLVLELINGGEFFELRKRKEKCVRSDGGKRYCMAAGALPEQTAQGFWRQLLSAVDYLHREGVCHRDISEKTFSLWCVFLKTCFQKKSLKIWFSIAI